MFWQRKPDKTQVEASGAICAVSFNKPPKKLDEQFIKAYQLQNNAVCNPSVFMPTMIRFPFVTDTSSDTTTFLSSIPHVCRFLLLRLL